MQVGSILASLFSIFSTASFGGAAATAAYEERSSCAQEFR
jgi:hypothetical protein